MSSERMLTQAEFSRALGAMKRPGGRVVEFLRAHVNSPGHTLSATQLAEAAGYRSFDGVNLQYGLLAERIRVAAGCRVDPKRVSLELLVDLVRPSGANKHWLLVMRPAFAAALKSSGWL